MIFRERIVPGICPVMRAKLLSAKIRLRTRAGCGTNGLFVLDTNAILYLLGGRLAESLPEGEYGISVVTEIELLSYPSLGDEGEAQVRAFLSNLAILGLSDNIIEGAVRMRRLHGLKLPDAIIVATALDFNGELLTNDAKLLRVPGITSRALKLKS